MNRLLFILKRREADWGEYSGVLSSGLRNSVSFVVAMLGHSGIEARMVEVVDNSEIDREVAAFRPTHVVLEAFWVVPEKLDELKPLHPGVRWIVRNHSEVAFLATEGIGFMWTLGYLQRGIEVMCNSPRAQADLRRAAIACGLPEHLVTYGPNHYPVPAAHTLPQPSPADPGFVHVGLFGAVRPLKNHMTQAVAALAYAERRGKPLALHINASRIEGNGDPILKSLRSLFAATQRHQLIEHAWMPHERFQAVLAGMDVNLQVSFSETFNIVSADAVAQGVPVVTSSEVFWLGDYAYADPTDARAIAAAMLRANDGVALPNRLQQQRRDLARYCAATEATWVERFAA